MAFFAVIDTETTWNDLVMSIGVVLGQTGDFRCVDAKYYVLTPEIEIGGMYDAAMYPPGIPYTLCSRQEALEDLKTWLSSAGVEKIFAYNAAFDCRHLPELHHLQWFDIMRLAAYRQHNPFIPACADCCSTGRLKRGYGVESMLRLLSGDGSYHETHNALLDARDELRIMKLLGTRLEDYIPL